MSYTTKQLNGFNLAQLNTIALDLQLNPYGVKKTKAQLIQMILEVQDNPELEVTLSAEAFQPTLPQFTREMLDTREMSKSRLQAIATLLEIEFEPYCAKKQLIDWILFAQEQATVLEENLSEDSPEVVEIESEVEPEVETTIAAEESDELDGIRITYHEQLVIYLYERSQASDQTATTLLAGLGEYIQSLSATKSTKSVKNRKPSTRVTDPAEKLAQAKLVWDVVQAHKGNYKAAAVELNKSPHYTKIIAQAYALYAESKMIRTAYDAGELRWSGLYNLAFNRKKADTLAMVEAQFQAA
jgi:hypothetical protein